MVEAHYGTPVDWNIVIAGAWNVAILTPDGIASRLFELEPGTPVDIQIPVNLTGPIQVKHEGIIIQPSPTNLVITLQEPNLKQLDKSVIIAQRAITTLPETPFLAVGLNFRFQFDVIPDPLNDACEAIIDDKLSDGDYSIGDKVLKRQLKWKNGVLNLTIHEKENSSAIIHFNYHKNSNKPEELKEWLQLHEKMLEDSEKIMTKLTNE